jgi:hypothetical protein
MTELEQRAARALAACRFSPATFDKRFARWIGRVVETEPERELTERGRACLWRKVWRYRRQILDSELLVTAKMGGEPFEVLAAARLQRDLFV